MLNVSPATWNALSQLLDEALNLEPSARAVWLAELATTQPQLAPTLQRLLAAETSSETADILARGPGLASLLKESRALALAAGARVGPYRLKRELGAGGMADVWLAERADGAFTRDVALKLPMMNRLRRDLAERFARERDILARLEHPHIARLYDAGISEDGLPYLAMEYVDGLPITEYCDAHKLDIAARLRLFAQVLDAVQFAHASLIIHRDLKPSNILVTASGEARLLDFGIAKLLAENETALETQLTQMAGRAMTPDYASPEQIKGESLTIATDVYSLGVVLYESLAGCRPYRLKVHSSAQLENAILAAEPLRLTAAANANAASFRNTSSTRLARALSGDLETITAKALRKAPSERYSTVAAFANDLRRHLEGRPVLARPTSWTYRARKFATRNKLLVASSTAVAFIMIVATAVSVWQAQRADLAATHAKRQAQRAEAVSAFLSDLFRASGSQQRSAQQARSMTAVDLLERGATRVEALQASAPDAHAYLLRLFGEVYEELELHDRSLQLNQKSVAAARAFYGTDARETVMAEMQLAWSLRNMQRADEGWPMVEHAQVVLRKIAPRSADYAQALYFESAFMSSKQPQRAVRAGEAALQLIEELGLHGYHATTARYIYAQALIAANNLEQAVVELRRSAAEFEQLFGPDYIDLAWINTMLSESLRNLGKLDEAREALQRAILIFEKHPEKRATGLAQARSSLGKLLQAIGDWRGAREQVDLAIYERLQSSEKVMPTVDQLLSLRGMLLVDQGSLQEGTKQLLEIQSRTPRELHHAHLFFCQVLARAYVALGNSKAAHEQIAIGKRILLERGATSSRAFALAAAAAQVAAATGDTSAALRELEDARKALNVTSIEPMRDPELALAAARVYDMLGQFEEVRTLSAPLLTSLLAEPAGRLTMGLHGELAFLAARARMDNDPNTAKRLLTVAAESLRKTQVPTSPLLKRVEKAQAAVVTQSASRR
ncbi:MAG TPA: serine/threonine-protein kinase [Burkholderiaceae bacterium]|nr:serine/threonine-protein kinase [Burkholderiaceae bacterium]